MVISPTHSNPWTTDTRGVQVSSTVASHLLDLPQGGLWTQIVSDVTGREQQVPEQTIGASYGDALMAAIGVGLVPPETDWATTGRTIIPTPRSRTL